MKNGSMTKSDQLFRRKNRFFAGIQAVFQEKAARLCGKSATLWASKRDTLIFQTSPKILNHIQLMLPNAEINYFSGSSFSPSPILCSSFSSITNFITSCPKERPSSFLHPLYNGILNYLEHVSSNNNTSDNNQYVYWHHRC